MTNQIETCNITKETIEVLKYFDHDFLSKIPNNVLKKLTQLSKESNITVTIDENKELKDQKISDQCKNIISMLYYKYIATNEEKKEIINIWKENDELYQKNVRELYNPDNMFKSKKVQEENNSLDTKISVMPKDNVINKIRKFFKKIFGKK